MLRFEWIAAWYFLVLALSAPLARAPFRRAMVTAGVAALLAIATVAASRTLPDTARVWLPHLYLVAGYWLPALITSLPARSRLETWLRQHDDGWRRHIGALPPAALAVLELSYLACLVVVPLAFVIIWSHGTAGDVERFWVAVLLAGFACYVTLPWLVSRPPHRFVDSPTEAPAVVSFNRLVLRLVSHQFNTFPSGHVAVATAASLTVFTVWPLAGTPLAVVAAAIAAGAAVGRYHYGIDVVAGALIGILTATISE
jgi:membrane-associated phospholipid phosphatase